MKKYCIRKMEKADIAVYQREMFDILAESMSKIDPSEMITEEDFVSWAEYMENHCESGQGHVILIFNEDDLCGYFQYSLTNETWMMEEIQFKSAYQGSGMFSQLYRYLVTVIPANTQFVEAYANKNNTKSQVVLKHLGLQVMGENKSGRSFHFRGDYQKIREMYSADIR